MSLKTVFLVCAAFGALGNELLPEHIEIVQLSWMKLRLDQFSIASNCILRFLNDPPRPNRLSVIFNKVPKEVLLQEPFFLSRIVWLADTIGMAVIYLNHNPNESLANFNQTIAYLSHGYVSSIQQDVVHDFGAIFLEELAKRGVTDVELTAWEAVWSMWITNV